MLSVNINLPSLQIFSTAIDKIYICRNTNCHCLLGPELNIRLIFYEWFFILPVTSYFYKPQLKKILLFNTFTKYDPCLPYSFMDIFTGMYILYTEYGIYNNNNVY